eukprot:5055023-Alexandrium_andersonii.AAC.1
MSAVALSLSLSCLGGGGGVGGPGCSFASCWWAGSCVAFQVLDHVRVHECTSIPLAIPISFEHMLLAVARSHASDRVCCARASLMS